jgi:HD-like signal output (HDOD) protein
MLVSAFSKVSLSPQDALKVLHATADENTGTADLVRLLRSQPTFSAEVIRHANSSAYSFTGEIKTLDKAVPLLDTETIRTLALAAIRRN